MTRTPRAAALALLVAALSAACGGSGGGTLSKDAYIAKADAICQDFNQIGKRLDLGGATFPALAASTAKVHAELQADMDRWHALKPPAADAKQLNELVRLVQSEVDLIGQISTAAEAQDLPKLKTLVAGLRSTDALAKATAIAKAYGFKVCSK